MKNTILLLLFLPFLFACESDTPGSNQEPKMVVEKDGVSFTLTEFTNTLIEEVQFDSTGRRLDLRADVDGGTLIVSVSNWDWQNPPEDGVIEKIYDADGDDPELEPNTICLPANGAIYCDGGLGSYVVGQQLFITDTEYSGSAGTVTITKNDPANRTVSGSFDFVVEDFVVDSSITFKGSFENLGYIR